MPGGRRIPLVVGYRNLSLFRQMIDPYFLGRPKTVVSDELPVLTTRRMTTTLLPAEVAKYREAVSGVLELGDGTVKDYEETKALTALIYCQLVVNSLTLLKYKEADEVSSAFAEEAIKVDKLGSKERLLMDILTEELDGEKVVVYTRFESLVGRLQAILTAGGITSVRITGKEKVQQRKAAQDAFQDENSPTKVIFITDAGSEAINLQAASALLFFDAPWSWGNYVQTLGRPQRLGSKHTRILVYHLVSELPGETAKERKTIDDYVLETLEGKKAIIDQVLGESAVGALTFDTKGSSTKDLVRKMQEGAKKHG
jgi:superfamily II DNA/RNA helicase